MKNVKARIEHDNMLVLTVDLTKTFGKSKSGKSIIVGTSGTVPVPNHPELRYGLNVFKVV